MEKPFRILSLDGGGLRGIYTAGILAAWEKQLSKPLATGVDLVVGTSTGGIIALALAAGVPAATISELYETHGAQIFPKRPGGSVRGFWGSRYRNTALRQELRTVFGDRKIRDCKTSICIPAMDAVTGRPRVFKTGHHAEIHRDPDFLIWKVALATSAAPTYLPGVEIEPGTAYVDGGLWANNPTMVGIGEAITYLAQPISALRVLSIGTQGQQVQVQASVATRPSRFRFTSRLLGLAGQASTQAVHNQANLILRCGKGEYFRLAPTGAETGALDSAKDASHLRGWAANDAMTHFTRAKPFLVREGL